MTAAPDPKVVREIARKLIAASANKVFAEDIFHASYGAVPASASGYPDPAKVGALHTAVEEAICTANTTATVSWPAEQPQNERKPCGAQLSADGAARLGASPDTRCVRPDGHAAHDGGNGVLWVSKPGAAQDERDGDVRAVAEVVVRLQCWLTGRQAHVHSKVSTTSVIAEPRDRSTAAWAIAESDVRAVVAALEARDAKAGEQR